MADDDVPAQVRNKKRGLKPIPVQDNTTDGNDIETRPAKRKPKKRVTNSGLSSPTPTEGDESKPIPRQRRKRSPSQGNDSERIESPASQLTATTPRKKKKKPRTDAGDTTIADPVDITRSQQEGQGSKASLISTPRKKGGKKKKKLKKTAEDGDDFRESPWAADLRTMKDDIITDDGQAGGEGEEVEKGNKNKPIMSLIAAPILRSQPLDKIFIETSNKFKGQRKSTLMRQRVEQARPVEPAPIIRKTTIDFSVGTHRIFRVIALFLHGLTAGLALWQLVIVFLLSSFSNDDFLEHYYRLSLPLQSVYYFLLVICTVSACDRFDIGNPTPRFVLRALTMQNGAVSIVFYLTALVLDIVSIRYDDRMYLYKEFSDLYPDSNMKTDEISTFKGINTARSVLIILSWFVLSLTPNSDRLGKSLKSGETGLEKDHELSGVSSA